MIWPSRGSSLRRELIYDSHYLQCPMYHFGWPHRKTIHRITLHSSFSVSFRKRYDLLFLFSCTLKKHSAASHRSPPVHVYTVRILGGHPLLYFYLSQYSDGMIAALLLLRAQIPLRLR